MAITTPREIPDYLASRTAVTNVDLDAPSTYEFAPFQEVTARFAGESLRLGTTTARLRVGQQLVESDHVGAVASVMAAITTNMLQNECAARWTILSGNVDLTDGEALFNATVGNLVAAGSKDAAKLNLGFAALAAGEMNGQPCGAEPRSLVVPAGKLLTAHALVDSFADAVRPRVFGVPGDWLGTGAWSPGALRENELAGSVILDAWQNVGFAPVARAGDVRIDMA